MVRLDQVSPEGQLWSKQYKGDIRDLLRLQDEIARAVTDEIQVKLTQQERARLASSRPVNPEAQDYYFRAPCIRETTWGKDWVLPARRTGPSDSN